MKVIRELNTGESGTGEDKQRDGSERKTNISSEYQIITKVKQEVKTIIGKFRPRRMKTGNSERANKNTQLKKIKVFQICINN